jgi:hypothetical protein
MLGAHCWRPERDFAESSDAMAFPAAMTLLQLLKGTLDNRDRTGGRRPMMPA